MKDTSYIFTVLDLSNFMFDVDLDLSNFMFDVDLDLSNFMFDVDLILSEMNIEEYKFLLLEAYPEKHSTKTFEQESIRNSTTLFLRPIDV